MRRIQGLWCLAAAALLAACGSGGGGTSGDFRLIQFLESGKEGVPRNRTLEFRFSAPVDAGQDLAARLAIQNIESGGDSNFSKAIGVYVVDGERVTFVPRLPEQSDRSDAGLRADGEYSVFLRGGPDSLRSVDGDRIATQQEFRFDTADFFEDPDPDAPPRALALLARDPATGAATEISRLDTDPQALALRDSSELLAAGAAIDPGAGGPPNFATAWSIELPLSEPLDPQTVDTTNVRLFQIREDALTGDTTATPGHLGDEVSFPVPIDVQAVQEIDDVGATTQFIRVTPRQTLVDDARYRIVFRGDILGIDFRNQFIGDNGMTGDGTVHGAVAPQPAPIDEVGGLGYVSEFLVFDRPSIESSRRVAYDPEADGIRPEQGQTTNDERLLNSSLYSPVENPGRAVGFLGAFGDGSDGPFAASGSGTTTLDTGAEPNDFVGNPFPALDLDPDDSYSNTSQPTAQVRTFDSPEASQWQFESLVVSSAATLRVTGVNPARIRVQGIVEVAGTVDASGGDGGNGGTAGTGGPGGFAGGSAIPGLQASTMTNGSCASFDVYLNTLSSSQQAQFPFSLHGEGPGRGYAGGEAYVHDTNNNANSSTNGAITGTGGGGGGHATAGETGEDRLNANGADGTAGPACSSWGAPNSLVIGLRGEGGLPFGDRTLLDVTVGGGGGGAGGSTHVRQFASVGASQGGGGGGGGGSLEIVASGPILATGGVFDVSGGTGGRGVLNAGTGTFATSWVVVAGSGGGGAGGSLSLISGDSLQMAGSILRAAGGSGGVRPNVGTPVSSCTTCNGGGDGGRGYIFLMDADGTIDGLLQNTPGDYDGFAGGVLSIRSFDATRFSSIAAVTELFAMPAADPDYEPLRAEDVVGIVSVGQSIDIFASSAQADPDNPLVPDLATEPEFDNAIPVARVVFAGGGSAVEILGANDDNMELLNPTGTPDRDAFLRLRSQFEYTNGVEAALGPFAAMDEVTIRFTFN